MPSSHSMPNPSTVALAPFAPGKYSDTASRGLTPMATRGMVTAPHHLATQAGMDILRRGGNAVEAAIAVASTLAVVYPQMNSIGGDNFWLIYNAHTGELKGLNGSGRSGENVTIEAYRSRGFDAIPARGYLAANTVPGAVSGWDEAYRYAVTDMGASLPWAALLDSARTYAAQGMPVTPGLHKWSVINTGTQDTALRHLQRFPGFRRTFLTPNAGAYAVGEILKQPALADTLGILAEEGAAAFYTGCIAERIVADLSAHGGWLTRDDFAAHRADWVTPLQVDYRGYTACNLPPNTQGMASLAILNLLNNLDVHALGEGSADYYHVLIEATKQAFADRDHYLTDPDTHPIPLETLLSRPHGQSQAAHIDMQQARLDIKPLDPHGDTVWFGVVDAQGHAVSMIQSLYHDFGSGIVAGDTGILLQNRGSFFSLDPHAVNRLAPRKRTFHTLNPAMLMKQGKPYLIYGTMGGEGQPQTQAAIVTRVVDFGMSPQDAINGPRWLYGRTWGSASNSVKFEQRVDPAVLASLEQRGHSLERVEAYADVMGHAGAILIDQARGVMFGATDPRSDGQAAGM